MSSSPSDNSKSTLQCANENQAISWSEQETIHLIQTYQEKWCYWQRGQLKANKWEKAARAIARRRGAECEYSTRSSIQFRYKMEKLHQRYRDEKDIAAIVGGSPSWHYFPLECLETSSTSYQNQKGDVDDECERNYDDECERNYDDEDAEDDEFRSKSRSINYILRKPSVVNRHPAHESRFVRVPDKKRKREEVKSEQQGNETELMLLAGEIRAFAERITGMERKTMEIIRETHRCRTEMENKREEMMIGWRQKISDIIAAAFGSSEEMSDN